MNEEISSIISGVGIIPKKSKGQNFLTDEYVAQRHVDYADIVPKDRVLEIGPGLGILTNILIKKSENVTCIELDEALADYISRIYGKNITLIRGDAVKIDFPPFDKFVSNLPYSVSTPIIFKLLEHKFKRAVIMVQKEFAERMVADVGLPSYSRLTVGIYYKADCRILETIPASKFNPKPKVDSALVEIVPRPSPFKVLDEDMFFKIVETSFNHRRKKIGTSLKLAGIIPKGVNLPILNNRIETLSPEEIGQLSDDIFELVKSCP
ncbi:MAG: 16S rRNA (adenine(1518)-N(6)/adenine(1519)-N(6))-dimethyltransferase RsmA [archaeon]|nr:16S rRNA (adenine(1518)-N(6)/adenine(1519)-N(6))-dimethyltransferase RsmA [archaeon]